MKLIRTEKENISICNSPVQYVREYWELNNKIRLSVIKYDDEDRCDINLYQQGRQLTQEIFDELIKIDKYKNVSRLTVALFDTKWIVVPKRLYTSIMGYIEKKYI